MAFDLTDEELQATREMNKTAWQSEIDKWSKEYLIERYKELVKIEKEHKKENGELREKVKELENADLTIVYMNGFYDGEKKWKDKIKELFKYKEGLVLDIENHTILTDKTKQEEKEVETLEIEIRLLQRLLQEGDK